MASARVRWRERGAPLLPRAVVGLGEAARALLRRLERGGDEGLVGLEGAAAEGALVVLGEGALPWAEGVVYLGRDPRAPSLLLPTADEPEVHPGLLAEAASARLGGARGSGLVAVVPSASRLIQVDQARALSGAVLAELGRRIG